MCKRLGSSCTSHVQSFSWWIPHSLRRGVSRTILQHPPPVFYYKWSTHRHTRPPLSSPSTRDKLWIARPSFDSTVACTHNPTLPLCGGSFLPKTYIQLHALCFDGYVPSPSSFVYTQLISVALTVYEYFITLEDEFALIWQRRWSGSTLLFAATRYLLLFITLIDILPYSREVRSATFSLLFFNRSL